MIPGSDNISPQANSPLGVMNGGNDNRENVSKLILKQLGRVLVYNLYHKSNMNIISFFDS